MGVHTFTIEFTSNPEEALPSDAILTLLSAIGLVSVKQLAILIKKELFYTIRLDGEIHQLQDIVSTLQQPDHPITRRLKVKACTTKSEFGATQHSPKPLSSNSSRFSARGARQPAESPNESQSTMSPIGNGNPKEPAPAASPTSAYSRGFPVPSPSSTVEERRTHSPVPRKVKGIDQRFAEAALAHRFVYGDKVVVGSCNFQPLEEKLYGVPRSQSPEIESNRDSRMSNPIKDTTASSVPTSRSGNQNAYRSPARRGASPGRVKSLDDRFADAAQVYHFVNGDKVTVKSASFQQRSASPRVSVAGVSPRIDDSPRALKDDVRQEATTKKVQSPTRYQVNVCESSIPRGPRSFEESSTPAFSVKGKNNAQETLRAKCPTEDWIDSILWQEKKGEAVFESDGDSAAAPSPTPQLTRTTLSAVDGRPSIHAREYPVSLSSEESEQSFDAAPKRAPPPQPERVVSTFSPRCTSPATLSTLSSALPKE